MMKPTMPQNRVAVLWNGDIVGSIQDVGVENFHVYGKWMPAGTAAAARFAAEFAVEGSLDVQIAWAAATSPGEVTDLADGYIDVLMHSGGGDR
jgi:hypothetical protein